MNIEELDQGWHKAHGNIEPLAEELKNVLKARWLRIHTLENGKRYAENPDEEKTILARHNTVLSSLHSDGPLIVLTCEWSETADHKVPEATNVSLPHTSYWKTLFDEASMTYRHIYATTTNWSVGSLDGLLAEVADDKIAGVIIAPQDLSWLYHPYDGGGDIIAASDEAREKLKQQFSGWLAK